MEPQYDNSARHTGTSKAEGRLKMDVGGKKKRKILKNKLKNYAKLKEKNTKNQDA